MATRRHHVARGVPRRQTAWIGFTPATNTIATAVKVVLGTLNAAALALRPFTLIRTHIGLYLRSDQAAADELQSGAFGVCIVNDDAAAVGITAVPGPVSDIGSDLWAVHQMLMGDAVSLTDRTVSGRFFDVDSKGMRKVGIGQDIAIVAENAVATGFDLTAGGRFLVKLH